MLISWMYAQVKQFILMLEDQEFVFEFGIGVFSLGMALTVAGITLGPSPSGASPSGGAIIGAGLVIFSALAGAFLFGECDNVPKRTYLLYVIGFLGYAGLFVGLASSIYPLGLPLLALIIIGEEAIFWLDSQKRPAGTGVLTFTTVKKLDSLNDVFIGLGLYGLFYEITGGIKPAENFFEAAAPFVAIGVIIVGGGLAILLLNSLKYGGPHAPEPKTEPSSSQPPIVATNPDYNPIRSEFKKTTAGYDPKTLTWNDTP